MRCSYFLRRIRVSPGRHECPNSNTIRPCNVVPAVVTNLLCPPPVALPPSFLQFAEMLSGRYADVLSGLFLGYSTLWYTSHHKGVKGLDKVTDYAMQVKKQTKDGQAGVVY